MVPPAQHRNTATPPRIAGGCTLEGYAAAKRLPVAFLRACGLSDVHYLGRKAVHPIRAWTAPPGRPACAWPWRRARGRPALRLDQGQQAHPLRPRPPADDRHQGAVLLVEGESDAQTCWFRDVEALGLPGAGNWNEGGTPPPRRHRGHLHRRGAGQRRQAVRKWLATPASATRARLVDLGAHEDPAGSTSAIGRLPRPAGRAGSGGAVGPNGNGRKWTRGHARRGRGARTWRPTRTSSPASPRPSGRAGWPARRGRCWRRTSAWSAASSPARSPSRSRGRRRPARATRPSGRSTSSARRLLRPLGHERAGARLLRGTAARRIS